MKTNASHLSATLIAFCLATVAFISLSACSTLHRSRESGYDNAHGGPGFSPDRKAFDREQSAGELGIKGHLSDDDVSAVDSHTRLRKSEALLVGRRERDQYFKNKPYMRNDVDGLEFLALDSFEDRNRWLNAHGIYGADTPHKPEIQALVDLNDITTGMTKQAVRDSWGEPELVEVAGNPLYGNERWAYSEQLPSSDGFQTEKRIVYFEGGRVTGWERH
jgi:outer membrane protein assembly factor BamE (lipoprotein component of BamABCDE complex)